MSDFNFTTHSFDPAGESAGAHFNNGLSVSIASSKLSGYRWEVLAWWRETNQDFFGPISFRTKEEAITVAEQLRQVEAQA